MTKSCGVAPPHPALLGPYRNVLNISLSHCCSLLDNAYIGVSTGLSPFTMRKVLFVVVSRGSTSRDPVILEPQLLSSSAEMSSAQTAQINTLPFEILASIFNILIEASIYARSIGDNSYGSVDYPTSISGVCAHWRRVAIGTPHLWSYIEVISTDGQPQTLERVHVGLERSQNSPLQLQLRLGRGRRLSSYSSIRHIREQMISIARSCAPRVHSLALRFHYLDFAVDALSALLSEQPEPSIRKLALCQTRFSISPIKPLPQNDWDRLLKPLHALHLEGANIELNSIPCRNLVELRLTPPPNELSLVQLVQFLESNPGLCSVVLNGFRRATIPSPSEIQSIKLPSLRSIQLSTSREFLVWFFKLLAPGPHELNLYLRCGGIPVLGDTSLDDTIILFSQQARIKSLSLRAAKVSLPPILRSLLHLQILGLGVLDLDPMSLAGLEVTANLLPKLHTIDLEEWEPQDRSELDPILGILLSLPTVRQVRYWRDKHLDA